MEYLSYITTYPDISFLMAISLFGLGIWTAYLKNTYQGNYANTPVKITPKILRISLIFVILIGGLVYSDMLFLEKYNIDKVKKIMMIICVPSALCGTMFYFFFLRKIWHQ